MLPILAMPFSPWMPPPLQLWLHTALCVPLSACCVVFPSLLFCSTPSLLYLSIFLSAFVSCCLILLSPKGCFPKRSWVELICHLITWRVHCLCLLFANRPAWKSLEEARLCGNGGGGWMGWQQRSQKAASSETKHLPVTPVLVNVCCRPWLGPNTWRMNVSIPWHQTKAALWHVWKLLTSTYTEHTMFRWRNASQEAHTSVIKDTCILWVLLSAQQFLLQRAMSLHLPMGRVGRTEV